MAYIEPNEKKSDPRSLPNSLALKAAIGKVQGEIQGSEPNTLPLPIGKLPVIPSNMRSKRYRTHDSLFTSGFPKLDEDAVKVDDKAGNFKSVPVDRTAMRTVGHTLNSAIRAFSYADWLMARLVRIAESVDHPDEFLDLTRALGTSLVHGLEYSVRTHAMLQLLERDAFLNRPSVQLTDELKGRARVVPLDPNALFAGKLAGFAKEATKDVQSNAWLFGRDGRRLDAPRSGSQSKQSTKKAKGGGKTQSKDQKTRAQPFSRGQRGRGKKPFSSSQASAPGPKDQRS